jgi:HAD superfamily hydrolase (TIGR01509 family)
MTQGQVIIKAMDRAAIFDIDGTLVDSVDLHARAWQDAFRRFGIETDFRQVRKQIGKGGDKLMPVFLSEAELRARGKEIQAYREKIFHRDYMGSVKPFPGVRQLFERILEDGVLIALASSATAEDLEFYTKLLRVEDLIHAGTAADDAEESKPAPDIFVAALQRLKNVAARDAIVVGDTAHDAEAAAKAGMRTIGLRCGGVSEEELREAGCVQTFRDPQDLWGRYEQSLISRMQQAKQQSA